MANLIADLKAILRLNVDTAEAKKAEASVTAFYAQLKRAKDTLKAGTFSGAVEDVQKINDRFAASSKRIEEMTTKLNAGRSMLQTMGGDQARLNSLIASYVDYLRQATSLKSVPTIQDAQGKALSQPNAGVDTLDKSGKGKAFQAEFSAIQDSYRDFIATTMSAQKAATDAATRTATESATATATAAKAAAANTADAAASVASGTASAATTSLQSVSELLKAYGADAVGVAKAANAAITDQQRQLSITEKEQLATHKKLGDVLEFEGRIRQSLIDAERARDEATQKTAKTQLLSAQSTRRALQTEVELQAQYKVAILGNIEQLQRLRDTANLAPVNAMAAQLKNYETVIASANQEMSKMAQTIADLQAQQTRYEQQLQSTNAAMQRLQQTSTRVQQNQNVGTLAQQLRNLQSSAVIAAGPLSGLGSRVAAFGGLVGRAGIDTAVLYTALTGLGAGVHIVIKSMVSLRREFEASIAMLDLTRQSTERLGEPFKDVTGIANRFGFAIDQIIKPYTKLKVAVTSSPISSEFKSIAENIFAIGGAFQLPTTSMERMIKALEQMLSKGVVQAEELRGQLGDVLPATALVALETFRGSMGDATMAPLKMFKAMKDGMLESYTFVPAFLEKFKEMFSIDASKQTDTLNAAFARLRNSYVLFMLELDKSAGITDSFKSAMNTLAGVLDNLAKSTDVFVSLFNVGFAVGLVGVGVRIAAFIAQMASVQLAIVSAQSGFYGLAAATISFRAALGFLGAGGLILTGLYVTWSNLFGGGREDAEKASQAVKEFGANLAKLKNATPPGDVFRFTAKADDAKKLLEEGKIYIKAAKQKLEEGLVLKPSIDLEGMLTNEVAKAKLRVAPLMASFNAALADKLNKQPGSRSTQDGERDALMDRQRAEIQVLNEQVNKYSELRNELIRLGVEQKRITQVTPPSSLAVRAFGAALEFVRDNASTFVAIGGTLITSIQLVRSGLLGAAAAAATTSGAWAVAASRLRTFGLVAVAAGAALAFFSKSARADEVASDIEPTVKSLREYIDVTNQTGKINFGTLRQAQEIVATEVSRVSQELQTARDELTKYDKTLKDVQGNDSLSAFGRAISAGFNRKGLPEKIEALEAALTKLRELQSEVTTIARQSELALGQAEGALFGDGKASEGLEAYNEKVATLRQQIAGLVSGRVAAAEATARAAQEEREMAKSLVQSGLSTEDAKAKLSEYMALYRQKIQLEASSKLDETLTAAAAQAEAARNGLLEQYNEQKRVNDEVERARQLAIEAGLSQEQVTQKIAEYRSNLEAVDAAQKKLKDSTDTLKGSKKSYAELIQQLSSPIYGLADSLGELASKGELTFRSFYDSMVSMLRGLIKETVAYIIKINILKPLLDSLNSSMAGGGGGVGGMIASALGGLGGLDLFASGGIISKPTFFGHSGGMALAGEAGAEAIMPLARGPGGRLGVAMHGDGGRPVTVHFTVNTPNPESFRRSESQISAMLSRTVNRGQRNL